MPRSTSFPAAALPAVNKVLSHVLVEDQPRELTLHATRGVLEQHRRKVLDGAPPPSLDQVAKEVSAYVRAWHRPGISRVLNATGVVLHTNLGRAPLGETVAEALHATAMGYCDVEMDMETGRRGDRLSSVGRLLVELTGAEDAVVVNNNAAAVLLAMTALASGAEMVISRGELVEIGGSFRIPDVAAAGGCRLVEVGTTNRTRLQDYQAAIGPETAGVLRVHPSNFRIVGFTERPARNQLVEVAHSAGCFVVEDLGSGSLVGGFPGEPAVSRVLSDGVDLVTFSGDKLLGGPQAGIAVGRADLVRALRGHPMYRALRLDKLVLCALDTTLRQYWTGHGSEIPALRMLRTTGDQLAQRADAMARALRRAGLDASCRPVDGRAGAGSLPERPLESVAVVIGALSATKLAYHLRKGNPPLLGRVQREEFYLDPRTLGRDEDDLAVELVIKAFSSL